MSEAAVGIAGAMRRLARVASAVLLAACTSHMGTGLPVTPQPSVLLTLSGNGSATSTAFDASGLSIDFAYTFACSSPGSAGDFAIHFYAATMAYPTPPAVPVDVQGTSGSATTTQWFNGAGGPFHFAVDSACTWTVTVLGKP